MVFLHLNNLLFLSTTVNSSEGNFVTKLLKLDPDPHWEKHLDPDPPKVNADPHSTAMGK